MPATSCECRTAQRPMSKARLLRSTAVPFSSMGRRNVSNVPAQALILLNDPLVAELSRKWGERAIQMIADSGEQSITDRVAWMYLSGFGRQPTDQELNVATAFLRAQASQNGVSTEAPELWAGLAHALVNTKEFIYLR